VRSMPAETPRRQGKESKRPARSKSTTKGTTTGARKGEG
jgi:hypothetical protein